jgi:hypothetical protein
MMSQSPQWPNEPVRPNQSPGSGSPLSRLARSRRDLTVIAMVTGFLTVALLGMLALALSSNTHGGQARNGQTQNGQAANAGAVQTATAGGSGNGTPTGGGSSGGGGPHPTPTPSRGSATLTPTSGIVTGGCCLTFAPVVHQVASQATLSGTSVGPVVATCPSGEIALSGGWSIPAHAGALVYSSARASVGSWAVYIRHGSSLGVTVYVECLANASGATIVERTAFKSVSPGAFDFTHATCNAGEAPVGGGFYSQTGVVVYGSVLNTSPNGWGGAAMNFGATSGQFGIYVECLTYPKAHSSQTTYGISDTDITPGNGGRAASPPCPRGTYISGGGFDGPPGVFYGAAAEGSDSSTT